MFQTTFSLALTHLHLKGLSHEIDFNNAEENWQMLALISAAAGFWLFRRPLSFLVEIKHLLSAKFQNHRDSCCYPINFFNWTPSTLFILMQCRFMSNQSEEASILRKPIGAKLWPSTLSRTTISTSVNTTWRTACLIQDFMERAGNMPTFLTWCQYYANSE